MSLGKPGTHSLPHKLDQASSQGFQGIELFIDDLDSYAETEFSGDRIAAAHAVRRRCSSLNLTIICLQPFTFYEGLLDRTQHTHLLEHKLPLWFRIAHALNTDLIQVPSNFLPPDPTTNAPRTTGDKDLIVSDLRELADLGAAQTPAIRFVYEALAWANHVYTWEASYDIVTRVNRPNLGLCLDTFHILGWEYADPAALTGIRGTRAEAETDLRASLTRLREMIALDPARIFYVQVVDGERLSSPLDETHEFHVPGRPSRMNWSRNARLFAFEEDRGGYLPVLDAVRAFVDAGFRGWVSLELFSRSLAEPHPGVPEAHAKRGIVSFGKMIEKLGGSGTASSPVVAGPSAVQHRL